MDAADFLRAAQRRFHGVDVHHDVRKRADDFLLVGELIAEFLHGRARSEQKDFLGLRERTFSSSANAPVRSFVKRRACKKLLAQLHRGRNQRQDARHGALKKHLDDDQAIDFVGALEDAIDAAVAVACGRRDNLRGSRSRRRFARLRRRSIRASRCRRPC